MEELAKQGKQKKAAEEEVDEIKRIQQKQDGLYSLFICVLLYYLY